MKNRRTFPAMVSLILLVSLITGCTWIGTEETIALPTTTAPTTTQDPTTTVPPVTVEFPLKEEVTLVLTAPVFQDCFYDPFYLQKSLSANTLWQDLWERTNVKIEIQPIPSSNSLQELLTLLDANNYGDILLMTTSSITRNENISAFVESGKLLALNDYVYNRNLMPNLNSRVFDEHPSSKGLFTSPDGNIYCIGSHNTEKSAYLESTCWINKTWLDMAEMDIPETLEELETFFAWVMENDCNGDGDKTDELPYYCYPLGNGFIEVLLGMWGLPTKNNSKVNLTGKFLCVEDGEVIFAPSTEGYKDFINTMNKWYENGWMPAEYFNGHSNANYEYLMNRYIRSNGQPERVAFYTGTGPNYRNQNAPDADGDTKLPADQLHEYICILPPTVEGYETRWHIDPGYLGNQCSFAISANCEYPEIALAWMDQFYSQEVTERVLYADPGSIYRREENGKIDTSPLLRGDPELPFVLLTSKLSYIITNLPTAVTDEERLNRYITTASVEKSRETLAMYEDVITQEEWPYPHMTSTATSETDQIYEKLHKIVYRYQTDWITGNKNINRDWAQYQSELKSAGVDRMIELMQEAYDVYLNALK